MANQTNTHTVSATVLGLLVLVIGFFLLRILVRSLVTHNDFVFAVSRRTFNVFLLGLVALFVTVVFLFARSARRRRLN
jgi:Na+-driven multidrug efflux pump